MAIRSQICKHCSCFLQRPPPLETIFSPPLFFVPLRRWSPCFYSFFSSSGKAVRTLLTTVSHSGCKQTYRTLCRPGANNNKTNFCPYHYCIHSNLFSDWKWMLIFFALLITAAVDGDDTLFPLCPPPHYSAYCLSPSSPMGCGRGRADSVSIFQQEVLFFTLLPCSPPSCSPVPAMAMAYFSVVRGDFP